MQSQTDGVEPGAAHKAQKSGTGMPKAGKNHQSGAAGEEPASAQVDWLETLMTLVAADGRPVLTFRPGSVSAYMAEAEESGAPHTEPTVRIYFMWGATEIVRGVDAATLTDALSSYYGAEAFASYFITDPTGLVFKPAHVNFIRPQQAQLVLNSGEVLPLRVPAESVERKITLAPPLVVRQGKKTQEVLLSRSHLN